ncbi:hypothetical protein JCM3775_001226 [Rhodotorula graminis]
MSYCPPPDGHPLASLSAAAAAAHSRSNNGGGLSLAAGSTSSPAFAPSSSMPHIGSSTGAPPHPPHHPHPYLAGHHSLTHSPESTTSPEHHHHQAGGVKRRRADMDGGESPGTAHGGAGGGKKSKSKTVSCTECKRRKIKCDRRMPCLACCKRGEPEACKWIEEAAAPAVDVQPFALTTDLVRLAARLEALEAWTQGLPPELRRDAPRPAPFVPEVYGSKVKPVAAGGGARDREKGHGAGKGSRSGTVDVDEDQLDTAASREVSDTEDAAIKLESMAFNARAPNSQYRPQDSIPFLDTTGTAAPSARPASVAYPAELTAWRTSIVAPPLVYEGPWSASAIGLDFCSNLDEMRAAKERALGSMWPFMPDKALSFKLVRAYFDEIDWLHMVLHRQSFEAEHERAWEMLEGGRGNDIDPMWLACYFMVCALAIDGLRCQATQLVLTPDERKRCVTHTWFALSQRLLQLGDGTGRPQVRYIQATILVGQWLQTCSVGGQASRFLSLMATAIRTAQLLGIHRLTDDPQVMPPADPAWPPNACSLRREVALRLFGLLSFLDFISASTRLRSYLLDPEQCTTPPCSNVNMDELSITTCDLPKRGRDIYTDSSFEFAKYRLARASREVVNKLVSDSTTFTYDTVVALDRKYRDVLQDCSVARMKRDISTRSSPSRTWKEAIAEEGLHSRLVRLHRPFMAKHAYSRSSCLESAEKLIRSHVVITAATKNVYFVYSHCLTASICLFVDLFQSVDQDLAEPEVDKKKEVLLIATDIFSRADEISSPSLRQIVVMGSKILGGLFAALEKRRIARAASALVPGAKKSDTPPESFAVVLQRLTQELDLAGNSAAPHLSPAPPDKPVLPSSSAPAPPASYGNNGAYLVPPSVGGASLSAPALAGAASAYPSDQPFGPGGGFLYDLNVVDVNSDAFLSGDFFRDVGLTAPNGALASFDFLQGTATPAPLQQQPAAAPPYGSVEGYYGGVGGGGGGALGWDFGAGGAVGGGFAPGEGGGQGGRMAATALMDQLTTGGGVW